MKKQLIYIVFMAAFALPACTQGQQTASNGQKDQDVQRISDYIEGKGLEQYAVATFAGGCFWCTEAAFERIKGVKEVISGYSGGEKEYPTYSQVSNKLTDHAEAIQIFYDPDVIDYQTLLSIFFVAHDPTQLNRQGPDVGPQYRSAVFYHDEEQKKMTEQYIQKLEKEKKFDKPIVTEISAYEEFWAAEGYHQDYYEHNPNNPYVRSVSKPKVEKVKKVFSHLLKEEYKM